MFSHLWNTQNIRKTPSVPFLKQPEFSSKEKKKISIAHTQSTSKSNPVVPPWSCVCECACTCAQSYPTLCDPIDCSPPGSSVHGLLQARIMQWVAISSSRGIFLTQGLTPHLSCLLHQQADSLLLGHLGSPNLVTTEALEGLEPTWFIEVNSSLNIYYLPKIEHSLGHLQNHFYLSDSPVELTWFPTRTL